MGMSVEMGSPVTASQRKSVIDSKLYAREITIDQGMTGAPEERR
jgi:hypothetical protein